MRRRALQMPRPRAHPAVLLLFLFACGSGPKAVALAVAPLDVARQKIQHVVIIDSADRKAGGPHGQRAATADIDGGSMDGFIRQVVERKQNCPDPNDPACAAEGDVVDVMGWHDSPGDPHPERPRANGSRAPYAWTDITYVLHQKAVSWAYYLDDGAQPDCDDDPATCTNLRVGVPSIWNPLPGFVTVQQNGQRANVRRLEDFFDAATKGTLPTVSWIMPNNVHSEHPPNLVSVGQRYVTNLVNAIMTSPNWNSTAIFLSWDDGGGFYDHVTPPNVGLRLHTGAASPPDSLTVGHRQVHRRSVAEMHRWAKHHLTVARAGQDGTSLKSARYGGT